MIESVIETKFPSLSVGFLTLTTAIGSTNATGLIGCGAGDIIYWTDDAGIARSMILTAANTFAKAAISVATAVTARKISAVNVGFNHFYVSNSIQKSSVLFPLAGVSKPAELDIMHSNNRNLFDKDEGFLIKSIFMRMPYQFTLADCNNSISIYLLDSTDQIISTLPEIGENGFFNIPIENTEISVNAYVNSPGQNYKVAIVADGVDQANIGFNVGIDNLNVSMINVPDAMNFNILPISFGMRVIHSIPMSFT